MGPAFLFLYAIENIKNRITDYFIIFGRVPFFFYVVHFYLIHLIALIGIIYADRPVGDAVLSVNDFISGSLADYGYSLFVVYIVWIFVTMTMYPICKWYNNYKANNRDKKWLSYL